MISKSHIQTEALEAIGDRIRAGVAVTVGGGKTLIGLKHMALNFKGYEMFLVAAPKRSIFNEWVNQAKEHGLSHLIPHIKFTTYLSLPKEDLTYDAIYLDECHSLLDSHKEWLSFYKGKILGLTGTPPKLSYTEKAKMVAQFCPIVYTYETDSAVDDGILNDYKVIVHTLSLGVEKNMKVEGKGKSWYTSERINYEYWTKRIENAKSPKETQIMRVMRMKALMKFPSKEVLARRILNESKNKILLFANTQEQADILCQHSYHSNNPDSENNLTDFRTGKITKLSCVLQLSEGVNIPHLKEGIIMHSYSNERKSKQRMGRLMRLNPNETSFVHVLCYKDTIDEKWVTEALEDCDPDKVTWI